MSIVLFANGFLRSLAQTGNHARTETWNCENLSEQGNGDNSSEGFRYPKLEDLRKPMLPFFFLPEFDIVSHAQYLIRIDFMEGAKNFRAGEN